MTREELIKAQIEYAKKTNAPMFAPKNGRCFSCGQDIVNDRWATELITGCPKCHRSYCD